MSLEEIDYGSFTNRSVQCSGKTAVFVRDTISLTNPLIVQEFNSDPRSDQIM